MPKYLNHLTITTGDLARAERGNVDDAVLIWCQKLLHRALSMKGRVSLDAPTSGCSIKATASGAALIATIYGPDLNDDVADPWVTLAVAARSTIAPRLWEELREMAPTHQSARPAAPWAAAILLRSDTPEWVGDFERCLAWAWLERSGR